MEKQALMEQLAAELLAAEEAVSPIGLISVRYPRLTYDDAFAVHLRVIAQKEARGERMIGKKIGLTSKAMQAQAGVFEPDLAFMSSKGLLENGGVMDASRYQVPMVEAEIAFVLREDLPGPLVLPTDVIRATEGILPALEIVDTRFGMWQFKIVDTVADSASYAGLVLGNRITRLDGQELSLLGMATYKNGELLCTGAGAAVMGNPILSVTWLANKLLSYGFCLKRGDIILSGAFAGGSRVAAGDFIEAKFDSLGSVSLRVA